MTIHRAQNNDEPKCETTKVRRVVDKAETGATSFRAPIPVMKNVDIVPGHPARESGYKLNIKSLMVHKEIFVSAYVYSGYK